MSWLGWPVLAPLKAKVKQARFFLIPECLMVHKGVMKHEIVLFYYLDRDERLGPQKVKTGDLTWAPFVGS